MSEDNTVNGKILIVDDESKIRFVLTCLLEEKGYEISAAENGKEAIAVAEEVFPDLILLDLEMPVMGGLEALKALTEKGFKGKVIILTAYGTIPSAVEAIRIGAFDYLTKPFDNDELLIVIDRALKQDRLERELADARDRLEERFSVTGIITNNAAMRKLLETVTRIGPTDTAVLISGESGTGKELIANAIHQHSSRRNKPFVPLNCGALPENIFESELFGHKKGAYTGANSAKPGLVERADGGTLFLDEVGEMGPNAQVKLLRFAQSGEFIPVGGTDPRKVNVRLVAASNRDLSKAVSENRFRADLFYRLNVVAMRLPPLRERVEDIPLLVDHFIKKLGSGLGKENYVFVADAMKALQLHSWPGNVRELENAVHSALVVATDTPMGAETLPVSVRIETPAKIEKLSGATLQELVSSHQEMVEKNAIIAALKEFDGNRTRVAESLGIGRNTLMRKMKRYNIS